MNIPYSSQAPCPHSAHGYSSAGHQLVDDLSSRRMAPQSESEPRIYPGGRRGRGPDAIWGRPGPSTARRARSLCNRQASASERTGPTPSNDEGGRYSARPPSRLREDQPGGVAKERPVPPRRTGERPMPTPPPSSPPPSLSSSPSSSSSSSASSSPSSSSSSAPPPSASQAPQA